MRRTRQPVPNPPPGLPHRAAIDEAEAMLVGFVRRYPEAIEDGIRAAFATLKLTIEFPAGPPGPVAVPAAPQPFVLETTTPIADLPEFLTIDELALYARIGRSAAYEFGRRHGVRFGRLVRVPREKLAALYER